MKNTPLNNIITNVSNIFTCPRKILVLKNIEALREQMYS